mgnify:CR=1 FL=1
MSVRTAKSDGKKFELQVYHDLIKKFPISKYAIEKDVHLDDVGIQVDFLVKTNNNKIVLVVEAKGGDSLTRKDGGARRTDNVKKALANGSLYKGIYPKSKFAAYFSYAPTSNSDSDKMIKNALALKYFDEVNYISPEITNTLEQYYG